MELSVTFTRKDTGETKSVKMYRPDSDCIAWEKIAPGESHEGKYAIHINRFAIYEQHDNIICHTRVDVTRLTIEVNG